MLNCSGSERLIARFADDPDGIAEDDRRELDAHLASCPACRAALEEQRDVARVLATRVPIDPPAGFSARLSARLREDDRWLTLVNWRAWTVGLVPIAAALVFVAWLMPSAGTQTTSSETDIGTTSVQSSPVTFDTWAASGAPSPAAAAFLQPGTSGDSLLEVVLTGNTSSAGVGTNVR